MAQFDVFRTRKGHVLDCQSDWLDILQTRFVVPLRPLREASPIKTRLNPILMVGEHEFVMMTEFASTVSKAELSTRVTSLATERDTIIAALDHLITGL